MDMMKEEEKPTVINISIQSLVGCVNVSNEGDMQKMEKILIDMFLRVVNQGVSMAETVPEPEPEEEEEKKGASFSIDFESNYDEIQPKIKAFEQEFEALVKKLSEIRFEFKPIVRDRSPS
jgi:hypothetical protein